MKQLLLNYTPFLIELGLLVIRVGIGISMVIHGYPKFVGGPKTWIWLGSQMSNLGITFVPIVWGFIAACTELFGGTFLAFGLGTRFITPLLTFLMFVALLYHLNKGDGYMQYSQTIELMVVFIGLCIAGSGRYSLDALLR